MRPDEPLLIICHSFPPNFGIGGRRWVKFAKELARRGHPVHVIRSAGDPTRMGSLWAADAEVPGICAYPLPQRYPSVLTNRPITSVKDKLMYRAWRKVLPLMTKGNWYDPAILWKQQLVASADRLITEHGIRRVVITGAPFSLLTHGVELKERYPELRLVADMRDPWTWGPHYGQTSLTKARMDHERSSEARVARVYDRLISPHTSVVDHLRNTYAGPPERYVMIPHAIDLDELGTPAGRPADDGTFRMIYAGSLYGEKEAEAYFDVLLRTFESMRTSMPDAYAKCRLDLYITGYGTRAYEQKVLDRGLEQKIRFHDPVAPRQIFQELAASDLVLAFIPSMNKDILGTKFNEIFQLRRPLLHIGLPGLVSRTILGRKLGGSLRVEEIEDELPRLISGEHRIELDLDADLSDGLLGPITDRLLREVLA